MWLREGVIRPVLDNSTTAFPQIPETFFAALLAVASFDEPVDFTVRVYDTSSCVTEVEVAR